MALIDEALDGLRDLQTGFEQGNAACHVFIQLKRGADRWKRLITANELAEQFVSTVSDAISSVQANAIEPDGLVEFDFQAFGSRTLGVLRLNEFPSLRDWLAEIPHNDWDQPFRPTADNRKDLRCYVTRITFPNGQLLEAFRSSRGAEVFVEHGGIRAWFQRDGDIARSASDCFMSFDEKIDFFVWDDLIFIINLGVFEFITDVRTVTDRHALAAVDIMIGRFDFGNVDIFKNTIKSKVSLAKKLATANHYRVIEAIDIEQIKHRIIEKIWN